MKKKIDQIIRKLRENKPVLEEKYKVKTLGVFGSYVRGEQKEGSDLDILVEFQEPVGLFKFMELEEFLGKNTGVKVDLVSRKALKPRIGKYILEEVINV
ncbi:MAG: nucleotidyltransferase family protein [ANME-2 cluster archaeon]|nr:nucleotidyltransferase family protein [ANME-2 cluster archaeon]MBC2700200.1 nucleotidyltransferase family protein [ANME-2 cluster archaeon]MBC2707185.1 nucleotidyltransferase family protein [ANME-2 cluster archaeon]MBC2747585.1 nucleotidyltransferase family protein [ANME-2 cluster archaeon]MBC2762888.1 nucleotidyltransferase family protein [ANME-2 cluster archaeon]